MKKFIAAIILFVSFQSYAQSWEAKYEDALFQHTTNNFQAFSREVSRRQGALFSEDDFNLIENRCLTKDGIFRLEYSDDQSTITVYYIEWIDSFTIDWLFTEASPSLDQQIRIHSPIPYTF